MSTIERVVKESIPNFVAIMESRLIGAVEVFPGTMCGKNYDGAEKAGHLGIQVDYSYRRRGIGRNLMIAAISDSARFGYKTIQLSVFESNTPAIRLYKSLGFLVYGHGATVTLPAGTTTRELHMVLNPENMDLT
jgi:ribosomal protein S18 acetylase RimI-like enzyme